MAKKKPEMTIKVGKVQIVVWLNKGEKYDTLSFAATKNYKDKDGEWQSSSSFSMADLADLQVAITTAQQNFRARIVEDNRSNNDDAEAPY